MVYFESFIRQHPQTTRQRGSGNPLHGRDVGSLSAPALADLDADGDPDVVAGETGGTFQFFDNTQGATTPKYAPRTGAANPLNGRDVGSEARPTLADLDGAGDFDLLSGNLAGDFDYFANTAYAAPALGDFDADGDLDLFAGTAFGRDALPSRRPLASRCELHRLLRSTHAR